MNELLSESTFKITKNDQGHFVLGIFQALRDGMADIGYSQTMIELSEYGINALEKNLKSLLLAVLDCQYPNNPRNGEYDRLTKR